MSKSRSSATSWKRETSPFRKAFACLVNLFLKSTDVIGSNRFLQRMRRFRFRSKLGSDDEKAVLYGNKAFSILRFINISQKKSDLSIQLVNSSVALQSCTFLWNTLSAHKRSGSGISGLGIDFH
jgi:hypothetical protein